MREKEISEGLGELADIAERDHEVQMARADLYKSAKYAIKLHDMLKGVSEAEGLEGWVQSKITKAADMLGSVYHHMDYEESGLADEAVVVGEAKDTHCSDKCCGSDVKREDCTCPPTCKHCNCNATNESTNEGPFKGVGKTLMKRKLKKQYKKSDLANFDKSGIDTSGKTPDEIGQMKSDYYHDNMDKAARAKKAGDRLSRKKKNEGVKGALAGGTLAGIATGNPIGALAGGYLGHKADKAMDSKIDSSAKNKKKPIKKIKKTDKESLQVKLEGKKKFKSAAHRKAVHAAKASGKR